MKIRVLVRWFSGLFVGLCVAACSVPDAPDPGPEYRLVRTTYSGLSGRTLNIDTTLYTYDQLGRLSSYTSHGENPQAVRRTMIYYNAENRIDHIDQQLPNGGFLDGTTRVVGWRAIYRHDAMGNVETVTVSKAIDDFAHFTPYEEYRFMYEANRVPSRITVIKLNTNQADNYDYTYSEGNIIRVRHTSVLLAKAEEVTYEYDDRQNVNKGIIRLTPDLDYYNRNNRITGLTPFYDERGLLVKTTSPGQIRDNITLYTYEEVTRN
ncbi:hypothetical protein HNV11_03945 [Spirosoma taeanense]|uniref:YD repeat-containing protein n=1 Tax=Spirosoma taeanense TaxID=2735870 RepID=A0A6M5Y598_9BACT|nr:hypothetical protein [Spirosoma taeanense]QJW88586.1 hypothetical protein HNV11_03945 [Spirosoma taeanense]